MAIISDGAEGIGTMIAHRLDGPGARVTIVGADLSADNHNRSDEEATTVEFISANPAREDDAVRVSRRSSGVMERWTTSCAVRLNPQSARSWS